jgi:sugar-specific transcriptional regulator TrmB
MSQDPILLELLGNARLDDKESRVYLAMLETGHATVHNIAEITGLKRPIIYVVLEDLIKKGFASVVPNKKIKTYQAIDPGAISAEMQTAAKNFSEMLPIFKTLSNRGKQKPKISFVDTKEGILKIYDEINRQKSAVFIASNARLNQYFPGASAGWQKSYQSGFNKLVSRTIIPDHAEDLKIARDFLCVTDKVQIRTLSVFDECNMDIAVYGNKLAITTFEDEPFLVIIESEAVPNFFLPIFEILWKTAKKVI